MMYFRRNVLKAGECFFVHIVALKNIMEFVLSRVGQIGKESMQYNPPLSLLRILMSVYNARYCHEKLAWMAILL